MVQYDKMFFRKPASFDMGMTSTRDEDTLTI